MKKNLNYFQKILLFIIVVLFSCSTENPGKQAAEELGWEVGFQAYTFKEFTFAEALDKGDTLGLKSVEAYPGQPIGDGIEGTTHFSMDQETRDKLKELLNEKGIKLNAYGVTGASDTAGWKQLFDFAKDMGIGIITSDPGLDQLDLVEELCDEYGIKVAFHNHPAPSQYWHPDSVLMAVEGRSNNLGVCADVGHWVRSGLDPVECLQKLEGRIIMFHFKDVDGMTPEAGDVIWGTGLVDMPAVLSELKRQGFQGLFDIEYEANWMNSVPDIKESLENFYDAVAEL
ncbi:MAG: endonuclease [Bacteroides sp. SM23_62_1]|nr:MAG: endonuclease [Bacteroides sp. SM23_62_1]